MSEGSVSATVQDVQPSTEDLKITVAPMRRRHVRAVLAIEAKVHARPWNEQMFLGELAQPTNRCYLIARAGAVVVGHAGVLFIEDEGHVTTVAVDPLWQRRHIATRLMAVQFRHALARGATALTLEVRASNTGARELYRRFGFAPAGIRKAYYPDNGEDAIIMWAHDIDAPDMLDRCAEAERSVPGTTVIEGVPHAE